MEGYSPSGSVSQREPKADHYPHVPAPAVTIRALSVKGQLRTRFFGQNSTKVLLNLVRLNLGHDFGFVGLTVVRSLAKPKNL